MAMIPRVLLFKEGLRFAICPYVESDVEELYAAAAESRQHVGQWLAWMTDEYSREHAEDWVRYAVAAWEEGTDYEFIIMDREDGSIAGSCGISEISRKYLMGNVGYWVRASRLNLGAARQAVQLLQEFGLEDLGLNRMEIVVAPGNEPSQRVAQAAGALYEGNLHQRLRVGETVHDAEMYALLRRRPQAS